VKGAVEFRDVHFRYSEAVPVIDTVSFHIPAGSLCVIVGPSGAGKSTLADLLLRFHDPQSGTITIDGQDLRQLRLEDLRRNIAVVEQVPYFFRASLRENIAYGRPDASFEEIRSCAIAAAVDDFIQSLPHAYETLLGERGLTLSVGERQRIALARALLSDPPILIMDEPTSALDPMSETAIISDFSRVLRGRTAILITHRMTLVELADVVVVIDGGKVVETGAPFELLAKDGFLSRQFQLSRISSGNMDMSRANQITENGNPRKPDGILVR
jgi:ATP-binding cassette subfamily B protein